MSVLVISWDRVGDLMAGSAVRALEMARALAASGLEAVLAAPDGSRLEAAPGLRLAALPGECSLASLIAGSDVVVLSGRIELMTAVKKPLVVDLYDPFILSNLDLFGASFARSGGRPLLGLRWLQHHLAHGDFFLCASPAQRSFWLGMLAAAGRINRANYEDDPELQNLLAVVPFGVPDEPPRPGPPVIKGVVAGIGPEDRIVLWAGGMWNWVDPLTLIRATALLRERRPEVKTLVLGTRHPNAEIGEMAMAREAVGLARDLGVLERGVWFIDWVPYEERHRYILDSDVGVSLHRRGVESEFAFRTRLLDHLWGLRPMVVTSGDDLAARIDREGLGVVVPPEDPAAVAAAIEAVLDDREPERRAARLAAARASLAWSRVIEPLRRFCAAPQHAPDHDGHAWFAPGLTRDELPRKEDALIADEYVTEARAISPALGDGFAPVQRFRAACENLCRIDVLMWIEPPVAGRNLVFELFDDAAGERCAARVVVPAAQLPHCDWQRFEFSPLAGSRQRELEFRLTLVPEASPTSPATDGPSGRVCVWRCAPPAAGEAERERGALAGVGPGGDPGLSSGDQVAFIARYLVAHVAEDVPVSSDSFLFLHNTTVPLAEPLDPTVCLAVEEAPVEAAAPGAPGAAPAAGRVAAGEPRADLDRLRADLARVAAQSALAEQRVRHLERELEGRIAAEARVATRDAFAEVSFLMGLFRDAGRMALAVARLAAWVALGVLLLLLCTLSVPLAVALGTAIALVDAIAWLRGRGGHLAAAGRRDAPPITPDAGVSIVIPTWNGRDLLEMSLPPLVAAVRRRGNPHDEIVVVDNGSDDGTIEKLARLAAATPELRTIALDSNRGFAGATNRGAAEARNPVLVLLNNDMVVEPDFLQPLVDAFVAEPGTFGVSCQIDFIDPEKPRWETGKVHARLEHGSVKLFHLDRFDQDLLYPVFFAGGGASAYDRARFLELGGFDEAVFSPVYIEDVDLGYRAWKRGWPSLLQPASRVHHKHRGTTRRLWSEARIHSFFVKNLAALLWKNASSWRLLARHLGGLPLVPLRVRREKGGRAAVATFVGLVRQLPAAMCARLHEAAAPRALRDEEIFHLSRYRHAFRARFHPEDRLARGRPQVLVVSPYSPVPAVHGGATRILNLLREIRAYCDVTLVSFYDTEAEARPESLTELRALCRDVVLVPRDLQARGGGLMPNATIGFAAAAMFQEVEHWLDRRRFDVVQVEYTHMAHYLPPAVPGLRRILVEHDIAFVALARARGAATSRLERLSRWLDGLRMLRYEVAAVEDADLVLTMSEADRAALARFVDPEQVHVVPNGVSCRDFPFSSGDREPATVLFVGFFRHDPNVEAVLWFARQVWPLVRARLPEARFRVVGAYPPPAVRELVGCDPAIEVTGLVPETASHYRSASVFVAPILRGSGTRLKILEAMASGCPVVSTAIGAEGLDASPAEIRLADAPAAFADAVCDLLLDGAHRDALTRAARAFVERRYDWPAIGARLLELYGFAVADGTAAEALARPPATATGGGAR